MGAKRIVPAILISAFFFHGWLQSPHENDFRESLNARDSASSVFIVGPHHHNSNASFPRFDHIEVVNNPGRGDLFLLHHDRFFLCFTCTGLDYIPKLSPSDNFCNEVVISDSFTGFYQLRAPPHALSTFS